MLSWAIRIRIPASLRLPVSVEPGNNNGVRSCRAAFARERIVRIVGMEQRLLGRYHVRDAGECQFRCVPPCGIRRFVPIASVQRTGVKSV